MKRGPGRKIESVLAAVLLLLCLLTGCVRQQDGPVLALRSDALDLYGPILRQAMPDRRIAEEGENPFSLLETGAMESFDVQAVPAIAQGVGTYWYPQCLSTVVIAVDRDQTDARITGWNDLLASGLPVGWNSTADTRRLLLGAAALGIEGEGYSVDEVLERLREQYIAGNFQEENWTLPVMVCMDHQAVNLIHQGRALEIVIPQEGTLTFAMGLLSDSLLTAVPDEVLLEGGLRLVDGRCRDDAYPPAEEYTRARRVTDFDHLLDATSDAARDIRRQIMHHRLFSPADGREHIMVPLIGSVLTLFWMASATHRSIRPDVQRAIRLAAALIVGWLCLRLFKYQLPGRGALERACWYGYYIFQMALPLVMLYIAAIFDKQDTGGRPPRWMRPLIALYPVLLLMVFTNDLHQLVFRFDLSGRWYDDYTYGPGYLVVLGYCVFQFVASIVLLICKSWHSPKRVGWLLPMLTAVLIMLYVAGYALNIPVCRDSDLASTVCCFAVLFVESAMRTGLLPSNTRYRLLFSSSPLDMQLLDAQGSTVLAASSAAGLEPVQRVQLRAGPSVCVSRDEDTLLFGRAIHNGTVVWKEDVGALNRLHQEIRTSVDRLEAANALLRKEGAVRRQKLAAQVKAELFDALEREIEEKTGELTAAIRALPDAPDRERQTACITLLLCHIKRRCNLFFLAREGREMPGDELVMYLDELSEFAGYAGVRALVRCRLPQSLELRRATLCYDFYFSAVSWSARESRATLLGQLEQQEDGLSFRILSSEEAGAFDFPASFRSAVEAAGGRVSCRALEETAGLYLTFPKGDEANE